LEGKKLVAPHEESPYFIVHTKPVVLIVSRISICTMRHS